MSTTIQITVQLGINTQSVVFFKFPTTIVSLNLDGFWSTININGGILTQIATISKTLNPGTHRILVLIPGSQFNYSGPSLKFPVTMGKVSFLFNSVPAVLKSAAMSLRPIGTGLLLVCRITFEIPSPPSPSSVIAVANPLDRDKVVHAVAEVQGKDGSAEDTQ